jgi:hypothetical protein
VSTPHRASVAATGIDLVLVAAFIGSAAWLAVALAQHLRRARRWPKPPKSWLRDFRAEAEERRKNGGRS